MNVARRHADRERNLNRLLGVFNRDSIESFRDRIESLSTFMENFLPYQMSMLGISFE